MPFGLAGAACFRPPTVCQTHAEVERPSGSVGKETFTPTHLHNRHLPTHLVVGLLLGAPNVELLLFTALAVVLLFMFNMNNSRGLPTFYCSTSPYHPVKCD